MCEGRQPARTGAVEQGKLRTVLEAVARQHLVKTYKISVCHSVIDCLRLAPFRTGLRVSSTVIDLVLIYGSVTPSPSTVGWLTLQSWTLNFSILLRMNRSSLHGSLYSLFVTMENICCLAVVTGTCLRNRCLSIDFRDCLLLRTCVWWAVV
jgi:hypothetical protein